MLSQFGRVGVDVIGLGVGTGENEALLVRLLLDGDCHDLRLFCSTSVNRCYRLRASVRRAPSGALLGFPSPQFTETSIRCRASNHSFRPRTDASA